MRIAYLNPWKHAAENQAFRSLQQAATRIGHELIHCANSDEIEVQQPDFVLATASTQPKLNDIPHYGTIHEPRDRFLTNRRFFNNLLTYDGYLTISRTLERFLRDLMHGVGRHKDIGFYYNSCQRQERVTDVATLLRDRRLIVTYFGTNWDHRRAEFFRLLSEHDGVQICGPAHSWPHINQKAYGGAPAFDGDAVQARYAANGVGLCLLSDLHLRDDIVSNRIFEITSVGALAICCDVPWIRRHFGDSVYYIDQNLTDRALIEAIMGCVDDMYADPSAAIQRATEARRIFEQSFAAEVLLANAVEYHGRVTGSRSVALANARRQYEPLISVIVRCGGRPLSAVGTALQTIVAQTYGRFEVVFVRYREIDLAPLLQFRAPNLQAMRVVDCHGGRRSAALWAGLAAVTGEYFCILDDDDWLFSNHFERLFQPFPAAREGCFLAFSGSISEQLEGQPIMGGGADRRTVHTFGLEEGTDAFRISGSFASNCFVASTDLLHSELMEDPGMATGEDSYLVLSLLAQAEPRFSYAGTSVHLRGSAGRSDFGVHSSRFEDLLTLRTRLRYRLPSVSADKWKELEAFWAERPLPAPGGSSHTRRSRPAAVPTCVASGYVESRAHFWSSSAVEDPDIGSAFVRCLDSPAGRGVELPIPVSHVLEGRHVVVAEVVVDQGAVDLSVLDPSKRVMSSQTLLADWNVQRVLLPVENVAIASVVVQNSPRGGTSIARVISLRVYDINGSE